MSSADQPGEGGEALNVTRVSKLGSAEAMQATTAVGYVVGPNPSRLYAAVRIETDAGSIVHVHTYYPVLESGEPTADIPKVGMNDGIWPLLELPGRPDVTGTEKLLESIARHFGGAALAIAASRPGLREARFRSVLPGEDLLRLVSGEADQATP